MGFNPAWNNIAALDRNALLVAQFDSAAARATRRIAQCQALPATSGCGSLLTGLPAAQALVGNAAAFAAALDQLYGGREGSVGLPFVPVSNGAAQQAITQRVLGFRDQFAALGITGIGTQGPVGGVIFSPSDLSRLLTDSAYGFLLRPLRPVHAYSPGEVSARVKLRLYQTIGTDAATIRGFAIRQSAGAMLRLKGGNAPAVDEVFAPTTGEGTSGFGVQSYTDLWYGPRYSASIVLGYEQSQAAEFAFRLPGADTPAVGGVPFPFVAAGREVTLSRTPGARFDIAVTPRLSLTRNIWLGASYYRSQQTADSWRLSSSAVATMAADAQTWASGTDWVEHRLGLGGTYSTVEAAKAGRARHAFDVTYQHQQTSAGQGWRVSRITRDVVSVRWYSRLLGH